MKDSKEALPISLTEAEVFARRYGIAWARDAHLTALREAMQTSMNAGRAVPRVATKFHQPAVAFHVPVARDGKTG